MFDFSPKLDADQIWIAYTTQYPPAWRIRPMARRSWCLSFRADQLGTSKRICVLHSFWDREHPAGPHQFIAPDLFLFRHHCFWKNSRSSSQIRLSWHLWRKGNRASAENNGWLDPGHFCNRPVFRLAKKKIFACWKKLKLTSIDGWLNSAPTKLKLWLRSRFYRRFGLILMMQ